MALCKKPYITPNQIPAPCGQCMGCLTNRKQLWTNRIILESRCHENNAFVTLTYNNENLPYSEEGYPTTKKRDLQLFIKRLRDRGNKFRYYAVSEYGTSGARPLRDSDETININPHFHLCVFGLGGTDFANMVADSWQKETGRGRHQDREALGFTYTGTLTPQSAAYVAGYVQKKNKYNKDMYEEMGIEPEKAYMSTKPAIGSSAIKQLAKIIERYPQALTPSGDVPISVNIGERKLPLGNYLREKLREELELDHEIQVSYDEDTGEVKHEKKIWYAKEEQKKLYEAEMQALRKNPEENKQAGPLPIDAQVSLAHFLDWKNKQPIENFEKRNKLFTKEKLL